MRLRVLLVATALVTGLAGASARAQAQSGYPRQSTSDQDPYGQAQGDRRGHGDVTYQGTARDGRRGGPDGDENARARPSYEGRPGDDADYAGSGQAPRDLGRDLGLRPDQAAALQAYRQATTPSASEQQRQRDGLGRLAGMTTPDRLDFTAQQMAIDQSDFGRRAQAVRRFYAQLTSAQQRRFDQLTAPQSDEGGEQGDGEDRTGNGGAPPR